jgi:arylsulfate sulfotransferase
MRTSQLLFRLRLALLLPILATVACGGGSNGSPSISSQVLPTNNALVARYSILPVPANATAWVEFGTDTTYGRQTAVTSLTGPQLQEVNIYVAGMKPSTTYHMRPHMEGSDGETWVGPDQVFTTGAIPSSAGTPPGISVTRPTAGLEPASGVEVFNGVAVPPTMVAFVTDLDGNIIWYYNPGNGASVTPMKLMDNGHFILDVGDLREIDLAGNTIRSVTTDQVNQSLQANGYSFTISTFHHDVIVLPNGHWITLANYTVPYLNLQGYPGVTPVLGDALVDIDLKGNVAWAWSAFDHLDVNRHPIFFPDWTHSNAIILTPDGNLLVSMRHQHWILKIDYANGTGAGDILWRLGSEGDFMLSGGDESNWFFAQHYPNVESIDGSVMTLSIVDNGDSRIDSSGAGCTTNCYTRATVFQVDEATKLATLLWQDLPGLYSAWGGSIGVLGNGNVEFDLCDLIIPSAQPASQIMEVTQTATPQTVWQLNLTGVNAYRGFRIPSLYPGVSWEK